MDITVFEWIMGGALLVMALFLVVVVAMLSGKDKSLSGTITGGSKQTFYGQSKTASREKVLTRLLIVVSVVFTALVVAMYVTVSKL